MSCFPGYTINIYVEMFHSEKQFDELEIFDGIKSLLPLCLLHLPSLAHTQSRFTSCLFMKSSTIVNKMHNT